FNILEYIDPTSGIRACEETLIKKNFEDPISSLNTKDIDADHVDLGQDGLGDFDWSEEADNPPVALALMATRSTDSSSSEVPYCSNCSKSYKKLLNDWYVLNYTYLLPLKTS
ncbi:hypothetical protein Tco_0207490, partial [Tanacetum coccineum]